MSLQRFAKIFLLLCIMAGCAWLQYLMDDGLGISWQQNTMRNWQDLGLSNLHGQLVTNPGGFEATTNPDIHKGMSPVCLYLAYYSTQIFAWTGLGTLSFHILLALAVFWGAWTLLGRDDFALAVAAASVLCPGYAYWQKLLDMNAISVLLALPYMAIVVPILKKPQIGVASIIGLFVLTLAFVSLNWTTAWVLGPATLLLTGLPQINRRAVALFIILGGVSSVALVIVSFMAKATVSHAGGGLGTDALGQFIRGYTWGDIGYGSGLSTGRAVLRLSFANGIGLLPLLLICGWLVVKHSFQRGAKEWIVISPFALAIVELALMRNYFGHHPWMSAPVLLAGLIFSMVLLRVQIEGVAAVGEKAIPQHRNLFLPAIPLLCFFYGIAVILFLRANESNQLSLVKLIRQHTQRSDYIVILKNPDPDTAKMAARLDYIFDRRVGVADDLGHLPASRDPIVVLSSIPMRGAVSLLAQSSAGDTGSKSFLHKTAAWFNRTVARRRPGDRLELAAGYYLYKPKL